ncbi:hypothetical protein [Geodermatophilus obscurus]|uniref:Uncharacterized protein n=1 Tax=Geodermatophilus obscurus (strain ATCC 25078 / DSM 43160 / JCM 3152 / CCUG 61914 / KCC A-0152 / KCTC 9177 / NBRC 13315 / NRRL B-3577 / G-20) TaxID=526225 RepID=D2SC65_GEOOG|nr:hypothetical protein [Geodermatophilus obscurus]ADB74233.1 hypothetical protein Gobs_1505 [Geodermatophilus obscurus DSM 43160]
MLDVEGSILRYQDHLESLVALCAPCHGRIDTLTRTGRCKRDEAENFLLDVIDRHGQLLLDRRVFAAADAAGIERWSLVDTRKRWSIRTRKFHGADGRAGSVSNWLVPEHQVPAPDTERARSREGLLKRDLGHSDLFSEPPSELDCCRPSPRRRT